MRVMRQASFGLALVACSTAASAEADPETLVNGLNAVFGKHEGARAAHANGICVVGQFAPSAEAANVSKAPHFVSTGPWKVVGRFSMGGGDPAAPNTQKDNVRGLALHIDLGNGNTTDMVTISAPVFLTRSPEDFLALLQTVATKDTGKINAFFTAHPEATRQAEWLKARPVPASYASVTYYGLRLHANERLGGEACRQVGASSRSRRERPSDNEIQTKSADFYKPELKERLARGRADFVLTAIVGEATDPTDDPTALWPVENRKKVQMGKLSIAAFESDSTCDAGMFDPSALVDGIEGPANDRIFAVRAPAYAVSFSRRAN